ncbi:phosphatase PAP2 family protein [Phenylobacterium sp.]|uniref:acid phosphatase n=1 Tax=Phenylobacterium sp. TaxID=1871053 RepID=UPI0028A1A4B0|nr:phosphatase PAP2 family protein [Phenylobacterium sp.]
MNRLLISLAAALALAASGAALAQQHPAPEPSGYLGEAAPDTYKILPPAPTPGTIRYQADRSAFLATRALKDSPRWSLASADADEAAIVKDMSCALGMELTAQTAPRLTGILMTARYDVRRAVNHPKDIYKRQRPYLIDEGDICVAKTEGLAKSPDYPSGHTTWGWTVGLILAELVPDRSTEILARARSFGESRLVCGVHNMSAVEAGRTNGSIVVAGLHGSARFRADMDAARKELAALRKGAKAPDGAACSAEAELIARSPYN